MQCQAFNCAEVLGDRRPELIWHTNLRGQTPLSMAVLGGRISLARFFWKQLQATCSDQTALRQHLIRRFPDDTTLMHRLATQADWQGRLSMKFMIEACCGLGSSSKLALQDLIMSVDASGNTALHVAADNGKVGNLTLMVACAHLVSPQGDLERQLLQQLNCDDYNLMLCAGNAEDYMLDEAECKEHLEVISFLLKHVRCMI